MVAGHGGAQWLHKDERKTLERKGYVAADGTLTEKGAAELERISSPLTLQPATQFRAAIDVMQGAERICTIHELRRGELLGETQDGRHLFVKLHTDYVFLVPPELYRTPEVQVIT